MMYEYDQESEPFPDLSETHLQEKGEAIFFFTLFRVDQAHGHVKWRGRGKTEPLAARP